MNIETKKDIFIYSFLGIVLLIAYTILTSVKWALITLGAFLIGIVIVIIAIILSEIIFTEKLDAKRGKKK